MSNTKLHISYNPYRPLFCRPT